MSPTLDDVFMRECFRLAKNGTGRVSPNPLVGCVLVRDGKIVARGFHQEFGGRHAEVDCLRKYRGDTRRTTLVINLEPCSHYGKTPPCADLIIQRGIPKVVVAMKDPNPIVSGKGIAKLRSAGVNVRLGVLEDEARKLNRFFVKHIASKIPYVNLKIAQTLDGMIALPKGRKGNRYITSRHSLSQVHKWRAGYDAVLVGAGTIIQDDPQLDVRFARGRNPNVIVLDGNLRVSGNERVFRSRKDRRVLICTSSKSVVTHSRKVKSLRRKNVEVLGIPSRTGSLSIRTVLKELYRQNVGSILVEGGQQVFTHFLAEQIADEVNVFVAPKVFGSGVPAFTCDSMFDLHLSSVRKIGEDILIHYSRT